MAQQEDRLAGRAVVSVDYCGLLKDSPGRPLDLDEVLKDGAVEVMNAPKIVDRLVFLRCRRGIIIRARR